MANNKGSIPWNKGKTNLKSSIRGKTYEQIFGPAAINIKRRRQDSRSLRWMLSGPTLKQLEGRKKVSLRMTGKNNPRYGKGLKGDQHPNWKGGKSFEPYSFDFNKSFKFMVKLRDSFSCVSCGMVEEDHKKLFHNIPLHIHHVNFDKNLSIAENCATTCIRCNSKANFNRPHWIKFYQSLLSERYGYSYIDGVPFLGVSS